MTPLFWFFGGLAAYWLYHRVLRRAARHFLGRAPSSKVRNDLLQGLPYDGLLRLRASIEAEIAHREPPASKPLAPPANPSNRGA